MINVVTAIVNKEILTETKNGNRRHDVGHAVQPIFAYVCNYRVAVVPSYCSNELGFQFYNR